MSSSRHRGRDDDDDFSPEDAFNLFTPIYRPGARDHLNVAVPPHIFGRADDPDPFHGVTVDTGYVPSGITLAGQGHADGGGPPPDLLGEGELDAEGWIFGENEDTVAVPLVLSLIGVFAVVSNLVVLSALVGVRRMRSGPHVMLANLAVADVAVVTAAVPTAVVGRLVGPGAVSPLACRSVHFVIFVGVYVAMYTLVVVAVFVFFGELLGTRSTGSARSKKTGSETGSSAEVVSDGSGGDGGLPVPLSVCSATVSCVVIWAAFGASHLTFVVQSDVAGLAAFEEPMICVYGATTAAGNDDVTSGGSAGGESTRARTLWITFLACAFLLPLTIVCALSAAVLRLQRRHKYPDVGGEGRLPVDEAATGCSREVEATQNLDNDGRGKRQLTVLLMALTVVRTVFWLPLQVFILADVFGPEPEMETTDADAVYRRKWELFCVCAALTGSCVTLPVLRAASSECRDAFRLVLRPCCGRSTAPRNQDNMAAVARRVQLVPGPPCSPSLTAAMLQRQRSYHLPPPGDEFDVGRPKHLSLPSSGRLSVPDVNETILSIISDSSNHINYA